MEEKQRNVLMVNDDELILKVFKRFLERAGYSVYTAGDTTEALARLDKQEGIEIGVVISDHGTPKMTGIEFLSRVKARSPCTYRVLMSTYAPQGIAVADSFVQEPTQGAYLCDVVGKGFEEYQRRKESK